jgi:uncharacterized RDD family membrane protein YckC
MTDEQKPQGMIYGQYAGFVTRLAAFVIDLVVVTVVVTLGGALIRLIGTLFESMYLVRPGTLTETVVTVAAVALSVGLFVAYYIGFWLAAGQTPGKRIMGVRIVCRGGGRVELGNVVRRFVGYWLSSFLFLGFLWVLVDNQRQAWHDTLAGTVVIYSRPTPPELLIPTPERVPRVKRGK